MKNFILKLSMLGLLCAPWTSWGGSVQETYNALKSSSSASPLHTVLSAAEQSLIDQGYSLEKVSQEDTGTSQFTIRAQYGSDSIFKAQIVVEAEEILDSNGNSHGVLWLKRVDSTVSK